MRGEALSWSVIHAVVFAFLYGVITSAHSCASSFSDEAEAREPSRACECVLVLEDSRVPLVVGGRPVEVW